MPDRIIQLAEQLGLVVPPPPHTPTVLGELAAAAFVRPQRSARRISREDAYLATAVRQIVGIPDGEVVAWQWGIGSGPLVGLVHGWEGRGSQLGAFAAPLVAAGFRVLTFDAPGHGESPGEVAHVPLVARVLVALERQLGPFDALVGHSMGAAAAATAAVNGCRLRGLVMLAPPLSQLERVTRVAGRLGLSPEVRDEFLQAVERIRRHPTQRQT
jgi:pimeloyl-ACP methyl ester carboxylesterase